MSGLEGAACRDEDPAIFEGTHNLDHEEAKAICKRCPVRRECHERAQWLVANVMGHELVGTWGGVLYGGAKKVGRPRKEPIR